MNYHALSLAKGGLRVQLCGYVESKLSNQVIENEFIEVIAVPEIVNDGKLPFLVYVVYKVIVQHYHLYKLLRQVKNGSSDGGRLDLTNDSSSATINSYIGNDSIFQSVHVTTNKSNHRLA